MESFSYYRKRKLQCFIDNYNIIKIATVCVGRQYPTLVTEGQKDNSVISDETLQGFWSYV